MAPSTCNQRVEELIEQINQLQDQRQALLQKRTALDLPALKMSFLQEILPHKKIPSPLTCEDGVNSRAKKDRPICLSKLLKKMVPRTGLEPVLPA